MLPATAPACDVRKAYLNFLRKAHPAKGGDAVAFAEETPAATLRRANDCSVMMPFRIFPGSTSVFVRYVSTEACEGSMSVTAAEATPQLKAACAPDPLRIRIRLGK